MSQLKKRHVFYIAGYDPRGVRFYHHLYKEQAAKQSAITGASYDVGPRQRLNEFVHRWTVRCGEVETTYDFLAWDDIVRREWRGGFFGWWTDMRYFYGPRVMREMILPICRVMPSRYYAGFFVPAYLAILALLSLMLAIGFGGLAGAICGVLFFAGGIWLGNRIAVFWVLKVIGFCARWGAGDIGGMDKRSDVFADHISAVLKDADIEEAVIASHSIGTILAVPVVARVLRQAGADESRLVLLTLAQSIPMVSFQKSARDIHQELDEISGDDRVLWVDYSAPVDGACFPLSLAVPGKEGLSPRFHTLYHADSYRKYRWNFYTLHFLYLHAGEKIGAYDYFNMTAGPQTMRARMSGKGGAS